MSMSGHSHRDRSSRAPVGRVLASVLAVLVAVLAAVLPASQAGAASTTGPTGIAVTASTNNAAVTGAPGAAIPTVLAAVNDPITLTVSLLPAGTSFNKDTTASVAASLGSGQAHGAFSPATFVIPAGATGTTVAVGYSAVENGVIATVTVPASGPTKGVAPGSTAPFDVLKTLRTFSASDPALGTGVSVGDQNCSQTSTESVCGTAILPHGITSTNLAMSLGSCAGVSACRPGGQVVQVIAGLASGYSATSPATLILRCDKSLCAGGGVKSYKASLSLSATGDLLPADACATKGVVNDGSPYCVDYVQSHRDNAGDLLLYVLFTTDMRGTI